MEPIQLGSQLGLFVDDHLIDQLNGVKRTLHHPVPREVVIEHDEPWEGKHSGYHTIFADEDVFRMYYRATSHQTEDHTAYAESDDGIHWRKPDIGKYEVCGTKQNNIIIGPEVHRVSHNFTPFKDPTVKSGAEDKYKAVGSGDEGLMALHSADGLNWTLIDNEPLFTREQGAFDSQNLVFWDQVRDEYRAYFRYFDDGRRGIKTATSSDFREWTDPVPLTYPDAPDEQLYTNGIKPYYREPHLFLGFPVRYVERDESSESMKELPGWKLREQLINERGRQGFALTDVLFMSSRDGDTFNRWPRGFIRPGLWDKSTTANWFYGANGPAWQLIETDSPIEEKPRELSLYAKEHARGGPGVTDINDQGATRLRRHALRIDGFVSVESSIEGGDLITKPLIFEGNTLTMNYATSAAGFVNVELQELDGTPIEGFSITASAELFGDDIERTVEWTGNRSLEGLAGKPIRLRFHIVDGEIFSFRFDG